jgi:chitin disaccharide deacetylase
MTNVTVCADDFGLTSGISSGILACLERRRISATSCMTARPTWLDRAAELRPFAGIADIGLHFTLTDLEPVGAAPILAPHGRFPPLSHVLRLSLTRRLPQDEIREQLARQLDAFEREFGSPPAHLDGHHHVHQLPGVREIVVEVSRHRYPTDPPYVRISHDAIRRVWHRGTDIRKCLMIGAFGRALRKVAARSGITTNEGFSGIYDFNEERLGVAGLFDRFLQCPGSRMLIMCHPGRSDSELRRIDSLTSQRNAELAFLLSDEWPQLLVKHRLQLGRLRRLGEHLSSNSRRSNPISTTS